MFCLGIPEHYTEIFVRVYTFFADSAVKYFCLAEALYYKTLENIVDQEKKRLGDNDLSVRFNLWLNIVILCFDLSVDSCR